MGRPKGESRLFFWFSATLVASYRGHPAEVFFVSTPSGPPKVEVLEPPLQVV